MWSVVLLILLIIVLIVVASNFDEVGKLNKRQERFDRDLNRLRYQVNDLLDLIGELRNLEYVVGELRLEIDNLPHKKAALIQEKIEETKALLEELEK